MPRPTPAEFGLLLWLVAAFESHYPGYSTRLQEAIRAAVPAKDQAALDEAAAGVYLYRPTAEASALFDRLMESRAEPCLEPESDIAAYIEQAG